MHADDITHPVGAVYDRAFFLKSTKNARSQTAPTGDPLNKFLLNKIGFWGMYIYAAPETGEIVTMRSIMYRVDPRLFDSVSGTKPVRSDPSGNSRSVGLSN